MNEFNERKKAFEKKFELDQEAKFRIDSRSAHLLGAWAAGQMGLGDAEAKAYGAQLLDLIVSKPGRAQLVKRIEADLKEKGVALSTHRIETEMENFYLQAREQILGPQKS